MKIDLKTLTATTLALVISGASAAIAGPPRLGGNQHSSGSGNNHSFSPRSTGAGNNGGQSFQSKIGTLNGNSSHGNMSNGNMQQSPGFIKIKTPNMGSQVSGSGVNSGSRIKHPLTGHPAGIGGGGFQGIPGIKVPGIKLPGSNPITATGPIKPLHPGIPFHPGGVSSGGQGSGSVGSGSNPSPTSGQNPGSGQNPSGNPGSQSSHHGGCHHHWHNWVDHIGHYVTCPTVVTPCVLPYHGCPQTTIIVAPWVPEIVLPGDLDLLIREVQIIRPADALNGPVYRVLITNNGPANLVGKGRFVLFGVNENQPDQNTPAMAGEFNGLDSGETAVVDVLMPVEANLFPFLLVALETPQGFRDIHPENNLAQGEVLRLPVIVAAQ